MKLSARAKLFLGSAAVFVGAALAAGLELEDELRDSLSERIETELVSYAELARARVLAGSEPAQIEALQPVAMSLSKASNARVTIIGTGGVVLADSDVEPDRVAAMENHGTRPEIAAAMKEGRGISKRHSATIDMDMLYIALPVEGREGIAAVRVAMPVREIDRAVAELRRNLAVAGIFGLAFALGLGALASQLANRQLSALLNTARNATDLPQPRTEDLGSIINTLARERRRFESVLEGLSDAVLAIDAKGVVTVANGAALKLLGLDALPIGRTLLETVRSAELKGLVDRAANEGTATGELELPGPKPRAVHVRVRHNDGAVIVLDDLTDVRRLEAVRKDFVANVSHELRTPVSVIRATTEALAAGGLDDPVRAKGFLAALERHSDRLSRLISELLDLSKLEAGRYPIELEDVPARAAIERAIDSVVVAAKEKKIAVATGEIVGELSVRADRRALEQILVNFLDNAVKYSQPGAFVRVDANVDDDEARIAVIDDGPGVESRHRDRLFERFYRVDPGRSRESGGTGLGLAIVKHLAEAMDGTVGVEPGSPKGSIFWVRLPHA